MKQYIINKITNKVHSLEYLVQGLLLSHSFLVNLMIFLISLASVFGIPPLAQKIIHQSLVFLILCPLQN
jgi:hypothetical protein